jgi:hypothetical protein
MLAIGHLRRISFGSGPLEEFWYQMEGGAQFADEFLILASRPSKLLEQYGEHCEAEPVVADVFFPTVLGAALLHARNFFGRSGFNAINNPIEPGSGLFFHPM